MCRILVASGNVDAAKMLENITLMAKDENSLHEMNQKEGSGSWKHQDGWGVAYLDQKGDFIIQKSPQAIFEDPKVQKLDKLNTNLLIAHVRRKAGSDISLKNTHPFKARHPALGECIFCHNGVIKEDIIFDQQYRPQGKTDSERLFYSILSDITENKDSKIASAIQKNLQRYAKTRGTNIVLATKEKTYVAMRKNCLPKYYGMRLGQGKDFMLISSEKLKTFPGISWTSILPGDVVTIQNGTTAFSISKEKRSLLQRITTLIKK
ncbi:MAG: class II glutamine amidotransferase [Nanoarchaeota archaeon]|nr:class II glutamine amidotransferase [Nanoarchaeota archaeon]